MRRLIYGYIHEHPEWPQFIWNSQKLATRLAGVELNHRQKLMLNTLLDGFDGKLSSSKWAKITKSSADKALRDISDLIDKGILIKEDVGGRSTSYILREF